MNTRQAQPLSLTSSNERNEEKTKEQKASRVIQSFWREKSFFHKFLSLVEATPYALAHGQCTDLFKKMITYSAAQCSQYSLCLLAAGTEINPKAHSVSEKTIVLMKDKEKMSTCLIRHGKIYDQGKTITDVEDKTAGLTFNFSENPMRPIRHSENPPVVEKIMSLCRYDQPIKDNLKMIAHGIFTYPDKFHRINASKELASLHQLLICLFNDQQSLVSDIIIVLKNVFAVASTVLREKEKSISLATIPPLLTLQAIQDKLFEEEEEIYWGERRGVKKTDILTVIHSGGEQCVNSVLYRGKAGYLLEGPDYIGSGLQVIVLQGEIEFKEAYKSWQVYKYANRQEKSAQNFDTHITLAAHVAAQYVLPANNESEGGLSAASIKYLRNVRIRKHSFYLFSWYSKTNLLLNYVPSSEGPKAATLLYERLENMLSRLSKQTLYRNRDDSVGVPETPAYKKRNLAVLK